MFAMDHDDHEYKHIYSLISKDKKSLRRLWKSKGERCKRNKWEKKDGNQKLEDNWKCCESEVS